MKCRAGGVLCAALLLLSSTPQALLAQPGPSSEERAEAEREANFKALEAQLHPQYGRVTIPAAHGTLELGHRYYFLSPEEAKRVLTEGWGNAPDVAEGVLGMVFPAGKTFRDQGWGAVIEFEDTGHISDEEAASQDYDSVLNEMKSATEENDETKSQGYPVQHLIGWAQQPTYDSYTKTLIWARNIQFEGQEENTLNYDVRMLGRTGVLSLNMVDSMSNLDAVSEEAKGLGATVKFDPGYAYADFDPSSDKEAGYGLAGLVAAGAGLAVAKKIGLLGLLLVFLKKAIVLVVAGFAGIGAWLKRKLSRR